MQTFLPLRRLGVFAAFILALVLLVSGSTVHAQSGIGPIPTTIPIPAGIYSGLVRAIQSRPAGVLPGERVIITSLDHAQGWALSTIALVPAADDEGESILTHSTLALLRFADGKWSGAVLGSNDYERLLKSVPESLISRSARPFLSAVRSANAPAPASMTTGLQWPWRSGQTWMFTQKRHGTNNASIDLAPFDSIPPDQRAVVAAANGVIIRRCDDDVQSSVAIRHSTGAANDDVTNYLHMDKNTVNRPTGSTIGRGETIGITYNQPIESQPYRCGYSTGPHVHFSTGTIAAGSNSSSGITLVDFMGTVVSGWTYGADECLTKASEHRCVGDSFVSDNDALPSPPSNPGPADGSTLSRGSNTVLTWATNGSTCDYHIWGGSMNLTPPAGGCASFTLGVQKGGSYQWQIMAHNSAGNSSGPIWHFNIRPAEPTNLVAAASSTTSINLTWTKSADDPGDVDGYRVSKADGTLLGTLAAGTTSYSAPGLTCGTSYTFSVKSVRQGVESAAGNAASATTAACPVSGSLVNGDFEKGRGVGWTEYSSGGFPIVGTKRPHAGSYSAYFCDYNSCTEYIQQTITVPSSSPTLTYWWYMSSTDSTTTAYDYLRVRLFSTSGTLLATLRAWNNTSARNVWKQDTLNLSAYAGQQVLLRFVSTTNASSATAFYVDDVKLSGGAPPPACYTLAQTANPSGGGTIGAVPAPNCTGGSGYAAGAAVTLTASPNSGYTMASWSGCDSASGNTCQVTMNGNRSVTANFAAISSPLVNGDFEKGRNVGWAEYSSGGYAVVGTQKPHLGLYSAYFCEYNSCTEYIQQQVTVPVGTPSLAYWWYMSSSEGTSTPYDYLRVRVYSTGGVLLATLRVWSNTAARGMWTKDTLALSAYAGQTVILRFVATTDSSAPTAFYVDDVSLQ